jgi:uncharacterized protein
MDYLFYLGHPAHYHYVSNVLPELKKKGHSISLMIRDKDVLIELTKNLNYDKFFVRDIGTRSLFFRVLTILKRQLILFAFCLKKKPNLLIGTSIEITHIGKLLNIPSIIIGEDDASEVPLLVKFGYKFANCILAPNCCDCAPYNFKKIGFNGYFELTYLNQSFLPQRETISHLFGDKNRYFIIRVVSLNAHHDKGKKGINNDLLIRMVNYLIPFGTVHISTERALPKNLEKHKIHLEPNLMHNALYFANLFIGDSQTMSAEAAILGTPTIRFNDFVGKLSYLEELEYKHNLCFGFNSSQETQLQSKLEELISNPEIKQDWLIKRELMLAESDDITSFLINIFDKYQQNINTVFTDQNK